MIVSDLRGFGDDSIVDAATQVAMNTVMNGVVSVMRATISATQTAAQASVYASAVTEPGWLDALLTPIVAAGAELAIGAPQNRRDAYLSALHTMSNLADKLDGPDRQDVLNGDLSLKRWLDAALVVQEGIYGVLQDMGADMQPAANFWNSIQTSYQWVEDHKDAIPNPFDPWTYVKWGIPILIGVAVIGGIVSRIAIGTNPVARRVKRALLQ